MEILKRTPRTDLVTNALIVKFADILEPLSEELNVPKDYVDQGLWQYMQLCTRVRFEKDEVDFEIVDPTDTPEQAAQKFIKYLDSDCIGQVDEARRRIAERDRPADIATAPEAPTSKNS